VLRYTLYPVTGELLAIQFNATEWLVACTPIPESEIVTGELLALLVTVTLPLSAPAAIGLKLTLNIKLWFGLNVTGVLAPLSANPVPLSVIPEICTLLFPVFVTFTGNDAELPAFTLPNGKLVVLNESVRVAATPVPLSAIVTGEFDALLTTLTLPVTAPDALGENCTLKLLDCPVPSETGKLSEPLLNPLPVTFTCVIESVPVPLFFN
jgi:hypothetical protein